MLRLKMMVLVVSVALAASAQVQVYNSKPAPAADICIMQVVNAPDALACDNDLDRGVPSICTFKLTNTSTVACTGHLIASIGPVTQGTVDQGSAAPFTTSCQIVGLTPLTATLQLPDGTPVKALESAARCEGDGTVPAGGTLSVSARITPSPTFAGQQFGVGATSSFTFTGIEDTSSVLAAFNLANCNLTLSGPATVPSGVPYNLTWTAAFASTTYEIQEATQPDFSDAKTTTTSGTSQQFTHNAGGTFYYRVRATTCRGSLGPYSNSAIVTVTPPIDPASKSFDVVIPQGTTSVVVQQVHVTGLTPNVSFSASVDQKFLSVTPSTGTVGADGAVDLTVRADPSALGLGATTGTLTVTTGHAKSANDVTILDNNTSTVPITVTVATPVTQAAKTPPPTTTWIIPAVAHATGIGAQFISDIRLANANTTATSAYQLTYTTANSDGSKNGIQTNVSLAPGQTVALTDVLHDFFGQATSSSSNATGVLEIRTVGTPNSGTFASSRTYSVATASGGTYGQFIQAVPIGNVATAAQSLILGHVGQSLQQRMNLGIVESLGFPATGHIHTFNASGQLVGDVQFSLRPFEQQQINSFLARNGISATNAHIEVVVDTPPAGVTMGGVTAYASMLDNVTNDASVITGVKASALNASRYVLPSAVEMLGCCNNHSDVRILNAGTSSVNATATFYPEASGTPVVKNMTIAPGEVKSYDPALPSLFGTTTGIRGSIVVTTSAPAPLLVTGRTYSVQAAALTPGPPPPNSTYGELLTAVMPTDGIGSTDGEMEILQAEESPKFRTDLTLAEISGAQANVDVTVFSPDSKVFAKTSFTLQPNESRTAQSIISSMGFPASTYNARFTVKVTGGSGRVTAFGSLVDNATSDPTLLPAQK